MRSPSLVGRWLSACGFVAAALSLALPFGRVASAVSAHVPGILFTWFSFYDDFFTAIAMMAAPAQDFCEPARWPSQYVNTAWLTYLLAGIGSIYVANGRRVPVAMPILLVAALAGTYRSIVIAAVDSATDQTPIVPDGVGAWVLGAGCIAIVVGGSLLGKGSNPNGRSTGLGTERHIH